MPNDRQRRRSKITRKHAKSIETGHQALRLRIDGLTWPDIAVQLGYSQGSWQFVRECAIRVASTPPEEAAQVVALELARIDTEYATLTAVERAALPFALGEGVVVDDDGVERPQSVPSMEAIDRVIKAITAKDKLHSQRHKWLGLDKADPVDANTLPTTLDGTDAQIAGLLGQFLGPTEVPEGHPG